MENDVQITLEAWNWDRDQDQINSKKMFKAVGATFVSMFFIQWVFLFIPALAGAGYFWWLFYQGKQSTKLNPMEKKSQQAKIRARELYSAAEGFMGVYSRSAQHVEFLENSIYGCESGRGWIVNESDFFVLYSNFILTGSAPTGDIYKAKATFADNTSVQHVPVTREANTNFQYQINPANNRHELESAETRFDTTVREMRGGSASVSIDGPKLVPGVILFADAGEAAEFANDFNQQVALYTKSKTEIAKNLSDLKVLLKEAKATAKKVPISEMEKFFNSVDKDCGYLVFRDYFEPLQELFEAKKTK